MKATDPRFPQPHEFRVGPNIDSASLTSIIFMVDGEWLEGMCFKPIDNSSTELSCVMRVKPYSAGTMNYSLPIIIFASCWDID